MEQITMMHHELPYGIAEQLKTLRTNIRFCGDDKRVLLLTSCLGGEGKSTVALELARCMAELEKRVLLIDCDLRKSAMRNHVVKGRITKGLTHFLSGQCSADDAVYQTESDGVYLMPAGAVPPNPSELLSNSRMVQLIASARNAYDYVIVDCAPLGMVIDAAVVAPSCDGSLLVLESGTIPYGLAQEVLQKLKNTHCPVLGAVLNKLDINSEKYYKYGKYGKYYGKRYEAYYGGRQV